MPYKCLKNAVCSDNNNNKMNGGILPIYRTDHLRVHMPSYKSILLLKVVLIR